MSDRSGKKICPKRHWLRFSVRGLLLLVLLVSIPLGLIGRDLIRSKSEEYLVNDIQIADGYVRYDYVYQVMPPPGTMGLTIAKFDEHEPKGHWLARKILGENIYSYVTIVNLRRADDPNQVLPRIATFSRLEKLSLAEAALTDESVDAISQLRQLRELYLESIELSPQQMRKLAAINSLETLYFTGSFATDDVLEQVANFKNLQEITLRDTAITNRALQSLARVPGLKRIEIDNAKQVTNEGLVPLVQLPELESFDAYGTRLTNFCARTLAKMPALKKAWISARDPKVDFGEYRSYDLSPIDGCDRSLSICDNIINLRTRYPYCGQSASPPKPPLLCVACGFCCSTDQLPNPPQPPPARTLPTLDKPLPEAFADVYNDPFVPADAKGKTTESRETKDPVQ